jgi:hypothetical protein
MSVSGSSSAVERQLPKLDVAGSIPVSRSIFFNGLRTLSNCLVYLLRLPPEIERGEGFFARF